MGLIDESKEPTLGSQGSNSGGGTEVLYGWLIGRAAADLSLAQALAASEARCKEQFKRLEDHLLSKMRELHTAHAINSGGAVNPAELDALKSEIERVSDLQRPFATGPVNEIAALNQQLITLGENMLALSSGAEDAKVRQAAQSEWIENIEKLISARLHDGENRLNDRLAQLEKTEGSFGQVQLELNALLNRVAQIELTRQQQARQWVQEIEAALSGKIQELWDHLAREQQDRHGRDAILNELRGEMQLMVQRLVQGEANAQQSHALMVNEAAQAAQLRDQMAAELGALQAQFSQAQERHAMVEGLGTELRGRIYALQNLLSQKLAGLESRDGEIDELKCQVYELAQWHRQKIALTPIPASRPPRPITVNVGLGGLKASADAVPAMTPMASASESSGVMPSHQAAADGPKDESKKLQQRLSADIERARAELHKRAGVGS